VQPQGEEAERFRVNQESLFCSIQSHSRLRLLLIHHIYNSLSGVWCMMNGVGVGVQAIVVRINEIA